jgi:hypothetical protein
MPSGDLFQRTAANRSPSVASQDYLYTCKPKRQSAAALQDAGAPSHAPENAKRLGVRLPSAAFWPARKVLAILRHHTSSTYKPNDL